MTDLTPRQTEILRLIQRTIAETARWYRAWHEGAPGPALDALCSAQIKHYLDADGAVVGDHQAP